MAAHIFRHNFYSFIVQTQTANSLPITLSQRNAYTSKLAISVRAHKCHANYLFPFGIAVLISLLLRFSFLVNAESAGDTSKLSIAEYLTNIVTDPNERNR